MCDEHCGPLACWRRTCLCLLTSTTNVATLLTNLRTCVLAISVVCAAASRETTSPSCEARLWQPSKAGMTPSAGAVPATLILTCMLIVARVDHLMLVYEVFMESRLSVHRVLLGVQVSTCHQ